MLEFFALLSESVCALQQGSKLATNWSHMLHDFLVRHTHCCQFFSQLYSQKEKLVLKITTVLLRSKSAVFYQSQDWSKSNKLKMTNKRGTVKLFTFSFEIDAPNIISCAPKIFSCAPKNLHLVEQVLPNSNLNFEPCNHKLLKHWAEYMYMYFTIIYYYYYYYLFFPTS